MALRTRADLKRELCRTIPPGEEQEYLTRVETELSTLQDELSALRTKRASLMRQISVRQRKLVDWKGKVPRTSEASTKSAQEELQRIGSMQCHRIGKLISAHEVHVEKAFASALKGVDGFSRIWMVIAAPRDLLVDGLCTGCDVYLCVVDVKSCSEKTGKIAIEGLRVKGDVNRLQEATVIDIKPYLSYCEAWKEDEANAEGSLDCQEATNESATPLIQ